MVRDRAGRAACHRLLERPQAPLCLGAQTAPSHPTSSRYRSNAESRIDLADAPSACSRQMEVGLGLVHRLIEEHGRQGALAFDVERKVLETAADYMADEEGGVGFIYSGFAQAALPHRRLADDAVWQVQTEHGLLLVEPGRRPVRDGSPVLIGVPYGSRARLIMLYLMTRAIETGCREVELGRSMRHWLDKMGIPQGGPSNRGVKEQAERLSRCRLSFQISRGGRTGLVNQNLV